METFFLVIQLYNSVSVIPDRYPKDQCSKIAERLMEHKSKIMAYCIDAPNISVVNNDNLTPFDRMPTYTCGPRGCAVKE